MANASSSVIVWDFDGTLTTTDTTKLLIWSLLRARPWRALHVVSSLITSLGADAQSRKASVLQALCKGLGPNRFELAAASFTALVRNRLRPQLVARFFKEVDLGNPTVVATASPAFAVRWVFPDTRIIILGMDFEIIEGRFSGQILNTIPYGADKGLQLAALMAREGWEEVSASFTDSLSDVPILEMAKEGFVVLKSGDLKRWGPPQVHPQSEQ